ncbi:MAG: GAF domain-containing protein [Clostridia bacterium]
MFKVKNKKFKTKSESYSYLNNILNHLISDEPDALANLANSASLFGLLIDEINWAGFYLFKNNELVLGPFWGKPACTHIAIGEGVCGKAAKDLEVQIVDDVDAFPGHIACDSDSKSEIVLPIIVNNKLKAVLDIDSPKLSRFNQEDASGLKETITLLEKLNWSQLS